MAKANNNQPKSGRMAVVVTATAAAINAATVAAMTAAIAAAERKAAVAVAVAALTAAEAAADVVVMVTETISWQRLQQLPAVARW